LSPGLHLQRARAPKYNVIIYGSVIARTAYGHGHLLLAGLVATDATVFVLRWRFPELDQMNTLSFEIVRTSCSRKELTLSLIVG
jgi:hypothetical protein